jgi:hypothetical protein
MKLLSKALVASVLFAAGSVANAAYITEFTSGMTSAVAGATIYDFEGGVPSNYSGAGTVVDFSVSGGTAAPAGDPTNYYTVAYPAEAGTGTFTADPGASYNYFGLYWGSIDDYNTLRFFNGGTLVATITGTDVILYGTERGDQTAPGSNRYVNFTFSDVTFDRVEFETTQYAFESDNHAFALIRRVPEPGVPGMFAVGLLLSIFVIRRRTAATRR